MGDKFHTCSLRCVFCQVQKGKCAEGAREATLGCAPAENGFHFICRPKRQTLRGLFDKLKPPQAQPEAVFYKKLCRRESPGTIMMGSVYKSPAAMGSPVLTRGTKVTSRRPMRIAT